MNNLTITPEKVKEAASKCPQAAEALKTLFPEVFGITPEWTKFQDKLGHILNHEVGCEIYDRIPGMMSADKSKWIINIIKKNL